jgi:hypothetical protein
MKRNKKEECLIFCMIVYEGEIGGQIERNNVAGLVNFGKYDRVVFFG